MQLTKEQHSIVLENRKLVYFLAHKLGITKKSSDYEDVISSGMLGLIKATITFDETKKNAFSTYAAKCITTEIFMYFREEQKHRNVTSFEEIIATDSSGNNFCLGDTIADPNSDFIENLIEREEFENMVSIILNYLKSNQKIALLYRMSGLTQVEVARELNLSQSYISRVEKNAILVINQLKDKRLQSREVFSMEIVENEYRISFSIDIIRPNKNFEAILSSLKSVEELPNVKINCSKKRIIIQVPADLKSFRIIAKVIQEIEEFSMLFVNTDTIKK